MPNGLNPLRAEDEYETVYWGVACWGSPTLEWILDGFRGTKEEAQDHKANLLTAKPDVPCRLVKIKSRVSYQESSE